MQTDFPDSKAKSSSTREMRTFNPVYARESNTLAQASDDLLREPLVSMVACSVVVPFYKCSATVEPLCQRLASVFSTLNISYEIVLVDDSGNDGACWDAIRKVCLAGQQNVRAVKLSRNFGQHRAITAGLEQAKGRYVVVMDCDLQDLPEEINFLYAEINKGFDYVLARRSDRQDSWFRRYASKAFYALLSFTTGTVHDPAVANFGIYSRKVVDAVISMNDSIRYFPVMVRWVGFRGAYLDVTHAERSVGKSSYSLRKMVSLAMDILLAFSDKPIRLVVILGLILSMFSFLLAGYFAILALLGKLSVLGWPSTIVSIWFLSGVIVFVLGCIGLYVGKIFEQTKGRPLYIICERIASKVG